ncbi:MAG TPA: LamG-like jellyroll fold domain-containing protein [Phycisphaerae bacterium]|nr:LamG-like jellyroll fold domain-containing protein [Phycisphaerae bacterium]
MISPKPTSRPVQIAVGHSLARGLCACWPFYADPNLLDVSELGPALDFNGSSSKVKAAMFACVGKSQPFSILCVARPADATGQICSQVNASADRVQLSTVAGGGTVGILASIYNGAAYTAGRILGFTPLTWLRIAVCWTGSDMRLYVEDAYDDTYTSGDSPGSTGDGFYWGSNAAGSGEYYTGQLAYGAVYDRCLSSAEVGQWMLDPWLLLRRRDPIELWAAAIAGAPGGETIEAAVGGFALSGGAASVLADRLLPSAAGSVALSGGAAGLAAARRIGAAGGAVVLAGGGASIRADRRIPAAAGAYALTGDAASIVGDRNIPAAAGAYTLTGDAASIVGDRNILAAAAAYALTGGDAAILAERTATAAPGSFTLTGGDANILPLGNFLAAWFMAQRR